MPLKVPSLNLSPRARDKGQWDRYSSQLGPKAQVGSKFFSHKTPVLESQELGHSNSKSMVNREQNCDIKYIQTIHCDRA